MLVKLYALRQPLVSRHTSEVLAAVAGNSSSHLGTAQLAQLLGMLIDGEASQLLSGVYTFGQSKVRASLKVALFIRLGYVLLCQ